MSLKGGVVTVVEDQIKLNAFPTKNELCTVKKILGLCTLKNNDYKLGMNATSKKGLLKTEYEIDIEFTPSPGKKYVLMTVDPDAPCRELSEQRYYLHYLNIDGKEKYPIEQPSSNKKGEHRYFTIYYTYDTEFDFNINDYRTKPSLKPSDRSCFDAIKFVTVNKLKYVDMVMMRI